MTMNQKLAIRALLVFSLLLGAGCYPKPEPTCQASNGSCTVDSDCCTGLSCELGTCLAPGTCGDGVCGPYENQVLCCQDCGCPSGQSCLPVAQLPEDKVCQTQTVTPVCGNGKCETGETMASCCTDCGCPVDEICQAGACAPTGGGTSVMVWPLVNDCLDGAIVEYRFFNETLGTNSGTPDTLAPGATDNNSLTCETGDTDCFGGIDQITGGLYGVGIDNTQSCVGCCFVCANGQVPFGPLVCN